MPHFNLREIHVCIDTQDFRNRVAVVNDPHIIA